MMLWSKCGIHARIYSTFSTTYVGKFETRLLVCRPITTSASNSNFLTQTARTNSFIYSACSVDKSKLHKSNIFLEINVQNRSTVQISMQVCRSVQENMDQLLTRCSMTNSKNAGGNSRKLFPSRHMYLSW